MRKAFTLIEMMISIVILSIMLLFLYRSYSSLNRSNEVYEKKMEQIQNFETKKKLFFSDFTLSLFDSVQILNQDKSNDVVFLQTTNSVHQRFNPYIAYIVKGHELYRLESLKPFKTYPLPQDSEFDIDNLGKIKSFRVYASPTNKRDFILHVEFYGMQTILMKIKALNEE
ncbi:prepilin-type N-terminal cleavage/methylation domain-containing protein [Sulfurimonas sp. HSL-1716]|uniref:prepilin-type N-terminal cleavage/methylation domain-containing protein n=1 Tax=Hydrocurvibacter sulfurireducens TaxID=3131937 RepID=UPI0031FA2B31